MQLKTVGLGIFSTMSAAAMEDTAATEPTDRSMPPVRMTKVMPVAIRPFMEICVEIFTRFLAEEKFGTKIMQNTNSRMVKSPTAYSCI